MSCCMANLENHIAWRYLFSKKGHNAINIVSGISAAAVMVVTAAMVCVLSVMNGFGVLVEHMFSEFDPALMVVPAEGTTLRTDTAPVVSLYAREDIEAVSMQLEQTALIRYKDHQLPARVMGVDSLFEQTASYFSQDERRKSGILLDRLDRYLPEPERPSLLHGDLWGGNYMIDREGNPWLIDPASYVGHAEADLAMTELFGGFSDSFYAAYREAFGIDSGYSDRKDLYNLYHLLKHLKLFGTGYLGPALSVLSRYA